MPSGDSEERCQEVGWGAGERGPGTDEHFGAGDGVCSGIAHGKKEQSRLGGGTCCGSPCRALPCNAAAPNSVSFITIVKTHWFLITESGGYLWHR